MRLMTADDKEELLRRMADDRMQDELLIGRLKYQVKLLRRALTGAATLAALAIWFDIVVEASRWISR